MHRMSKKTAGDARRLFRGIASGPIFMARFTHGSSGRMPLEHEATIQREGEPKTMAVRLGVASNIARSN